jgi:D-arabinose 1-dehydrogenase-like Zn-dependent alcohol dehydrogenase
VNQALPPAPTLPTIEHAIQFVGPGQLVHNRAKIVPVPGPTQLLVRVEAVGICFSDTKLLKAFSTHLRKARVTSGMDRATLGEIPSYVPGELPTVPGHEVAGRIVVVGEAVTRHAVGERVLVQTDYRHLATPGSNAAFGYNFEGGLQEYVLLDERMIIEPGTGARFLIPVDEAPSGSAVALLEPWACVEASYASRERATLARAGRLLVVADAGRRIEGLAALVAAVTPVAVTAVLGDASQRAQLEAALGDAVPAIAEAAGAAALPAESFDDVVYFGADPDRIEQLQGLLATGGVIDIVLGGDRIGRPVAVDVGRIHYDLTRWVGTPGGSAADGYAIAHLADVAGPLAASRGIPAVFLNSRTTPLEPGFSYVAVMVPAPPLVAQAVDLAGDGARINIFAGFAAGTRAAIDLDAVLAKGVYLFGTSGSQISDMETVLGKLERGELDTNISVDAITGMEGVTDALAAVEARTSGGKIVVYPALHDLGMVRLSDLAARLPAVARELRDGRWTRAAEDALLSTAADAEKNGA